MKMPTRRRVLVEDMCQDCLAEPDADGEELRALRPLQAAAATHRIAFGPRTGQKMLILRDAMPRETAVRQALCAALSPRCQHASTKVDLNCRYAGHTMDQNLAV